MSGQAPYKGPSRLSPAFPTLVKRRAASHRKCVLIRIPVTVSGPRGKSRRNALSGVSEGMRIHNQKSQNVIPGKHIARPKTPCSD
jgi:hypothetical protein